MMRMGKPIELLKRKGDESGDEHENSEQKLTDGHDNDKDYDDHDNDEDDDDHDAA